MQNTILKVNEINAGYKDNLIIKNISFSLNNKEIIGIIGPNGSGKTTLLKTISGTIQSKSGNIILFDKDIKKYSRKELAKKISIVSQSIKFPDIIIEDFVIIGRIPYFKNMQFFETNNDINIAEKYMKLTDIYRLKDKIITEISDGERQLAVIAKALTQEPEILLLDEPINHLDITHQIIILDLIKKLKNTLNISIIIVLHDINFACEYCDKILILKNGNIYKKGNPKDILLPEIIKSVYNVDSVINNNPVSKKPYAIFLSNDNK